MEFSEIKDEKDVHAYVLNWAEMNNAYLCLELHKKNEFLDRLKRYLNSPDSYLEASYSSIIKDMERFQQIYQTIIITVILGTLIYMNKIVFDNLFLILSNFKLIDLISVILIIFLDMLIFIFRRGILRYIRTRLFIGPNLREKEVELYYISTILKYRKEKMKTNHQLSDPN